MIGFKTGKLRLFAGIAAVLLTVPSNVCDGAEPPPPVEAPKGIREPDSIDLNIFFDRTESMRGFLAGKETNYVKALRALWEAASVVTPRPHERIYDYGDMYTREYKESSLSKVKDLVRQESFYGMKGSLPRSDADCDWRKDNGGKPFSSVAEYIKTLNEENTGKSAISIVVTDLYDLGMPNPFVLFFSDAFSSGLSGAIFAIESSFSGTIESVSSAGDKETNIPVRNGKSTFFICIAGDGRVVSSYCSALSKELRWNNIDFNNAVFMVTQGENTRPSVSQPVLANKKEFADPKNVVRSMNIDREDLGKNVLSYRLLKFDSSRWAAGLALSNINHNNFTYSPSFEIFLWGKQSKNTSPGWRQLSDSGNIGVKVKGGSKIPLYVVVETKNKSLSPGYYKINYKIIPSAKTTPKWVAELDAPDIHALEESAASGERVKVLQIKNVYEKIAEAFNKVTSKTMYSSELYLIKR